MPRRVVDPFSNSRFRLSLGDAIVGGFQTMSAATKISGLNKATDVTFKRGVIAAPALQDWLGQVKKKRTITVELRNEAQTVTAHWTLRGTLVVKHNADPQGVVDNQVPIETLVLSAERIEFVSDDPD